MLICDKFSHNKLFSNSSHTHTHTHAHNLHLVSCGTILKLGLSCGRRGPYGVHVVKSITVHSRKLLWGLGWVGGKRHAKLLISSTGIYGSKTHTIEHHKHFESTWSLRTFSNWSMMKSMLKLPFVLSYRYISDIFFLQKVQHKYGIPILVQYIYKNY